MNTDLPEDAEQQRYEAVRAIDPNSPGGIDALVRALYDGSWRVRKAAADRMRGTRAPGPLITRLLEVLSDRGATGARNAAAEALVQLGAHSVPGLLRLLQHDDPDQRKFAADILGPIAAKEAEPALIAALQDPDPNVRVSVAEALGQVGGRDAPRALEQVLATGDTLLRLSALEALVRLRVPPALPTIVSLLEEPALRKIATRALGLVRQPAALKEISRALSSPAGGVREAALVALGLQLHGAPAEWVAEVERELLAVTRREPQLFQTFVDALELEELDARKGALFALGLRRSAEQVQRIAEAAQDDRLAEDVARTLVRMGPAAARELAVSLELLSAPVRLVAAEVLVQLADPSLAPALEALVHSAEPELQLLAVRALGRAQSTSSIPTLVGLFADPSLAAAAGRALMELARSFPDEVREVVCRSFDEQVTPAAVRTLGAVGGPESLRRLRLTARDPDAAVRAASAAAAGELGGEGAQELLRIALTDEAVEVRASAAGVLGRLAPADAAPLLRLALVDDEPDIVVAAIQAGAEANVPDVCPRLKELVRTPDGRVATAALRTLSRLGQVDPEVLESAAHHRDPEVLREALLAGAALPEAVVLARKLLIHDQWDVRAAAARVLGSSGGPQVLHDVLQALERETDPLVRDALGEARNQLARR